MAKRYKWLLLMLIIAMFGLYLATEPLYTPTAIPVPAHLYYYPSIIAHKSLVSKQYIGNTLPAIQEAMTTHIDGIEVDVRLSKDGVLFLYHGETLEVATNGQGIPAQHTWAELSKLRYKDNSKLLTLEQIFTLVGSQKIVFLDVKSDRMSGRTRRLTCF